MLYILPIEPVKERYSIQWLEWFKNAINNLNLQQKTEIIDPPSLMDNLGDKGEVLNIYNTNYYKSIQMAEITKLFQQNKVDNINI